MSNLIDALAHAKPRLLAMSPLIAAGAVATVAAAPAVTTGVAVVAGIQMLSGIAGNILATDIHAKLSELALSGDVLTNHDLARAVKDAINAIILDTAKDVADKREREALELMARADADIWAEAEALLRQPQAIESLATHDIIEMFSKSTEEFARFKALDPKDWRDIVGGLAAANSISIEGDVFSAASALRLSRATVDLTASRLHETFPRSLYEILKRDFADKGEAYGGLLLRLIGNISERQIETLAAAYEVLDVARRTLATAERIEGDTKIIKDDTDIIKGKVDGLHEKLDSLHPFASAPTPDRLAINLPPHNRIFTGRRDVLDQLKDELDENSRAVLSGMPGVGKTQTANQYAHEQYAARGYDYVIYVRAATETEMLTALVSAAHALNLPAKSLSDFNQVAMAVKSWLESADGWLLIFDNADDLSFVRSHVPVNPKGHVIFTRRPEDAGGLARTIRIRKMNETDGARLLLRRAELMKDGDALDDIAPAIAEEARAISREIDGLPLSLDIAGAFIKETSTGLGEYLDLYRKQGRELRRERDPNADYEHSVATAFALAFSQLATPDDDGEEATVIAGAAADLLRLCAFLAPDAIPLENIFTAASEHIETLQRAWANVIWRKKSIARTLRYTLLEPNAKGQTYDMHREVQAVMRDVLHDESQSIWAERALQSLLIAFPDPSDFKQWEPCDFILPHAQACLKHGDELNISTETVASLESFTGLHLYNLARYEEAEPLLKQALELRNKLLGQEHPDVATSINDLAELYSAQGRYEEAEPLYVQALELYKKLLGQEHPDVATSINNLALLYHSQGRYEEAEPLYVQALELYKKLLGQEHPDVATIINNLAGLYHSQGRYEEAEPLFVQALELYKKLLGQEHPDVATSINNLAELYRAQGRYEEAEPLFVGALAIAEKALGAGHPNMRGIRRNLEMFQEEQAVMESERRDVNASDEDDGG